MCDPVLVIIIIIIIIIIVCKMTKKEKNKEKIKTLVACIWEMDGAVSFKFRMWTALAGGQLCSKFGSNRIRDHRDTKV